MLKHYPRLYGAVCLLGQRFSNGRTLPALVADVDAWLAENVASSDLYALERWLQTLSSARFRTFLFSDDAELIAEIVETSPRGGLDNTYVATIVEDLFHLI